MEILPEIKKRKSPLVFDGREVETEKVKAVIEAARWSPSCYNNQPWNFVFVGKNDRNRFALEESLSLGNSWAKKAPYLVAVGADPSKDCDANKIPYYAYDTGLSVMSAAIEAEHHGLRVHQMAGWKEEKVKRAVGFPKGFRLLVVFALGYEGSVKTLWDKLEQKVKDRLAQPRTRKPAKENFFFGEFKGNK
ncbi:MAG: nitroreductase family protein [Candidatus Aenigmarchaeota archaeon]|nr:nitroreductase family protein [Candidatus Aenigmarchaeota archaeon]